MITIEKTIHFAFYFTLGGLFWYPTSLPLAFVAIIIVLYFGIVKWIDYKIPLPATEAQEKRIADLESQIQGIKLNLSQRRM
jgi:hypothetical protein